MSERVLTERELNRALLARQLLLERTKLSLPRALERMGGIQNQYAPNAYIRLWSCLDGFRREQLNRALERRTVVRGTLMRTTIHLISAREYWLHAGGLQRSAREWQLRVDRETKPAMRRRARPAALDDVASWAGVPVTTLRPALERLELRRLRDEQERELFDLRRARLPSPDAPAPVRVLPTWDAILLVHARRAGVLPEEYRPVVFNDKNPPSVPTFLGDGRVAGAWHHTDGRIELEPYERLSRMTWQELRREAERLARFLS